MIEKAIARTGLRSWHEASAPITVELEGCQRLIPADGNARKVAPDLLAAVAGN